MQRDLEEAIKERHNRNDRTYARICNATDLDIVLLRTPNSSRIYPGMRPAGPENSSKLQLVIHLLEIYSGKIF
jgi:hypothetical protein